MPLGQGGGMLAFPRQRGLGAPRALLLLPWKQVMFGGGEGKTPGCTVPPTRVLDPCVSPTQFPAGCPVVPAAPVAATVRLQVYGLCLGWHGARRDFCVPRPVPCAVPEVGGGSPQPLCQSGDALGSPEPQRHALAWGHGAGSDCLARQLARLAVPHAVPVRWALGQAGVCGALCPVGRGGGTCGSLGCTWPGRAQP